MCGPRNPEIHEMGEIHQEEGNEMPQDQFVQFLFSLTNKSSTITAMENFIFTYELNKNPK
jgi:hypothetical protein